MSAATQLARKNRRLTAVLLALTVAMFGFGYALVPLYEFFCELTGLNGKTGRATAAVAAASMTDESRWVTVEFTAQAMAGLPWEFRPVQNKMRLHPGETATVRYLVRNLSTQPITGQATPSVSPSKAAPYFKKVECFCFTRQELKGGESREMPVTFFVQRDLPPEIRTFTLSYAFFNVSADKAQARSGGRHG